MKIDWTTFLPDLLVGMCTGLVVGAALLLAQWLADSRRERAASAFAWESLKPKVAGSAHRSWRQGLDGFLPLPAPLVAIHSAASELPLGLWKSHLKRPDSALDALQVLLRLHPSFESAAQEADDALEIAGIHVAERTGVPTIVIDRIVRSRTYGMPDSNAYLTVADFAPSMAPQFELAADQTLADARLSLALDRYRECVDIYRDLVTGLRRHLSDT